MNFKYFKTSRLIPMILILALLFQPLNNYLQYQFNKSEILKDVTGYIGALSTIGMLGLVLTFLNLLGWKCGLFKWIVDLPNLNGRYRGTLTSSYKDEHGNPIVKDCVLEIKQTASSIHICAYYADQGSDIETSKSYSVSEQIIKEPNDGFSLYYVFSNEASTLVSQLHNHHGTAHLKYYPDIKTLEGEYYNKRSNTGSIKVQFEGKKLLRRLKQ